MANMPLHSTLVCISQCFHHSCISAANLSRHTPNSHSLPHRNHNDWTGVDDARSRTAHRTARVAGSRAHHMRTHWHGRLARLACHGRHVGRTAVGQGVCRGICIARCGHGSSRCRGRGCRSRVGCRSLFPLWHLSLCTATASTVSRHGVLGRGCPTLYT